MNSKFNCMIQAFIQSKPGAAAVALERYELSEAAQLICMIPLADAVKITEVMTPRYTALLFERLPVEISVAVLTEFNVSEATNVLRHLTFDLRLSMLQKLPTRHKNQCQLLLKYDTTTVGAWMTTQFLTVPAGATVEQVFQQLSQIQSKRLHLLYATNEGHIKGLFCALDLLNRSPQDCVRHLTQTAPPSISGYSSLASIASSPHWETHDHLPVTNKKQHLIGILRHQDLRKGLQVRTANISEKSEVNGVTDLLDAYGSSLIAFYQTMCNVADL